MDKVLPVAVGRKGEQCAVDFLVSNGYEIVERNWRYGHLEIDVIALKNLTIHFVEVKCLQYPNIIEPYLKVNRVKERRIIKAANGFLNSYDWHNFERCGEYKMECECLDVSFDVVSIVYTDDRFEIEFYEGAYSPRWF